MSRKLSINEIIRNSNIGKRMSMLYNDETSEKSEKKAWIDTK